MERQAHLLFERDFVTCLPDGVQKSLYDFADYCNGAAFKSKDYSASGLPIVKIAELKNGITGTTQHCNDSKKSKYLLKDGDILFSWSGNPDTSIDTFIWTQGPALLNQHIFNVRAYGEHKWFVYSMLKWFNPTFAEIARNKQTTGLGHITASDLKRLTFIYNEDAIKAFERKVNPIYEEIYHLLLESCELIKVRDSLLPRLMSGEIDVSEVEI